MSGFSLTSPYRPNQQIINAPARAQPQGDYYAVYDFQPQGMIPISSATYIPQPYYQQPVNPPYPVMTHPYQTSQHQYQPMQQGNQQLLPPPIQMHTQTPPPPPPLTQTSPADHIPFSHEEIEEALKVDNMEEGLADLSDSDSELLNDDYKPPVKTPDPKTTTKHTKVDSTKKKH
jgi:hypothetical protein